ncbi:hypothetical protein GCM10010987_44730 [Bradyrhizobium guangdongense]|nr:hypothetical protein GCM10010987_44730 [Bradyrhizobium guangdongense]
MGPMRLLFNQQIMVALCGADCQAVLNQRQVAPWSRFAVAPGDELAIGPARMGLRAYLCVPGGIDVPEVLGSRSTYFRQRVGGLEGRMLRVGDKLGALKKSAQPQPELSVLPPDNVLERGLHALAEQDDIVLRVVRAGEYDDFTSRSQQTFWRDPWRVSAQSNRMGYRLDGAELMRTDPGEMRSCPITPGVIQVPPGGRPIVQLVDGNSAGGYPKIGYVIEADLWRVAQARPGSVFRFVECSVTEARKALSEIVKYLDRLGCLIATADNGGVPARISRETEAGMANDENRYQF